MAAAKNAREISADANLEIVSYGSYYTAGEKQDFDSVIATACKLKAPLIRVWAGRSSWKDASQDYRRSVIDDLARIASLSSKQGIAISMEFHNGTLNDDVEPALEIIRLLKGSNVLTHWQPPNGEDGKTCAAVLAKLLPSLSAMHVFHLLKRDGQIERRPLTEGAQLWRRYFDIAASSVRDRYALLEFVKDDSPAQFLQDAAVLNSLVSTVNKRGENA